MVSQCHTDGGAFAAFPHWFSDAVVGDWNHLTLHGNARIADTAWITGPTARDGRGARGGTP
jgi:hypothetical protein